MKNKSKIILTWTLSVLIALIIGTGATMKLAGLPQLEDTFSKIGLLQYMGILGVAELSFVALFLLRRSMKIGFLLLTGYFGGAMAVEMSHGTIFIIPGAILTLIWVTAYLRDASIFKSVEQQVSKRTKAALL